MKLVDKSALSSLTAILMATFIITSCSGGGCSGCGGDILQPIPGGYPGALTENLGLARVSKNAITFLQTNLQVIIGKFMPSGLSFAIPAIDQEVKVDWLGGWKAAVAQVCNGSGGTSPCNDSVDPKCKMDGTGRPLNPQAPCCVCANIDQFTLTPVNPNKIDVKAKISAVEKNAPIYVQVLGFINFTCTLDLTLNNKDISTSITLSTESSTKRLTFDVSKPVFTISGSDISLNGPWYCDVVNWDPIKNFIIDLAIGALDISTYINDALEPIKCAPCVSNADCPSVRAAGVHCDTAAKQCKNSSNQCVPIALGIEGELDIGSLLSSVVPGITAKVQMAAEVGGTTTQYVSAQGINVPLMGEASSQHNECVPQTDAPVPTAASLTLANNAPLCLRCDSEGAACPTDSTCDVEHYACRKTDGTCPTVDFMAGIGIKEYLLSKTLWSAFDSGALCLDVGSSNIPALADYLTASTLSIFIPELKDNLNGNAPVLISLRPQKAPIIKIGAGIIKKDEKGNPALAKPHITLMLPEVVLDFYVVFYERNTRIFTVTTDIEVPVALDVAPDPENPGSLSILPVISGLNMTNTQVTNYEVLAYPPDFIGLVSSLVGQLLPSLLKPFSVDLSSLQGFSLELLQIKGEVPYSPARPENCNDTDDNPATACEYQYLTIFANLGLTPTTSLVSPVTTAEHVSTTIPPVEKLRLMGSKGGEMPEVLLKVSGDMPDLEYSYRIDGGTWSLYRRGPAISVSSAVLAIPGEHEIQVRSRVFNKPMTTDMKGARVVVMIDYVPPKIRFEKTPEGIRISAYDDISHDKVKVMWRTKGGQWNEIPNGSRLPSGLKGKVEVQAIDEGGSASDVSLNLKSGESAPNAAAHVGSSLAVENGNGGSSADYSGGWGCSSAAVDEGLGGIAAAILCLFVSAFFMFGRKR